MSTPSFKLIADLIFNTAQAERTRFIDYCRELKQKDLVIDLEQVTQCDSAGLAFLIEVKRISRSQGREAKIINMPAETKALAEFYGISEILLD